MKKQIIILSMALSFLLSSLLCTLIAMNKRGISKVEEIISNDMIIMIMGCAIGCMYYWYICYTGIKNKDLTVFYINGATKARTTMLLFLQRIYFSIIGSFIGTIMTFILYYSIVKNAFTISNLLYSSLICILVQAAILFLLCLKKTMKWINKKQRVDGLWVEV